MGNGYATLKHPRFGAVCERSLEGAYSIPQTIYRRVRKLARNRNQSVDAVLEAGVTMVEASTGPLESEVEAMHPELMAHYAGQYVAIYQGQLIDHDQDEIALLSRLDDQYPDEVVLMKKVRPLPEPELRHRSPRLVRNGS